MKIKVRPLPVPVLFRCTMNPLRQQINQSVDKILLGWMHVLQSWCMALGIHFCFFWRAMQSLLRPPFRFKQLVHNMEFIGNQSLLIVLLTGVFTGLAFSYQIYRGFILINATNLVGPTVALGISRELAPVLVGLVITARAGGAMAARLGTMRVTEQIDAMEVMGVDAVQYLVAPRILAAALMLPFLCAFFSFVAMLSSYILCVSSLGLDEAMFMDKVNEWIEFRDLNEGFIKSMVFGLGFGTICTYQGFFATGGARGVGEATNKGVVHSMVYIIIVDYFVTNIMLLIYGTGTGGL